MSATQCQEVNIKYLPNLQKIYKCLYQSHRLNNSINVSQRLHRMLSHCITQEAPGAKIITVIIARVWSLIEINNLNTDTKNTKNLLAKVLIDKSSHILYSGESTLLTND